MIRFDVVTLFPEMFAAVTASGITRKALEAGLWRLETWNPRDFTTDKYRTVDDRPYGGGPGMVMRCEPVVAAIEAAAARLPGPAHRVLLTPSGAPLTQARVRELAALPHLVLVCGRYEGVDERVAEHVVDEELSLGDFVLTGGELAALVVIDAVARLLPGVLGNAEGASSESFTDLPLLEYPQYTRPQTWRGHEVPEILLSGHHARIEAWRLAQRQARTRERRPDLWARYLAEHPDPGGRAAPSARRRPPGDPPGEA